MDDKEQQEIIDKEILRDDDITKTEEGTLIFNPFNPLNTKITLSDVQYILKKYNLQATVFNIKL